jgi:hypothetical protein
MGVTPLAQLSAFLVMDRRRNEDDTQVHDPACPEVPDLRQPA